MQFFRYLRPLAAALCLAAAACAATSPGGALPGIAGDTSRFGSDFTKGPLLYATDAGDNIVYMIALPSGKLVGKLTGFYQPTGVCVDQSGDVFITDSQHQQIVAYRHGQKQAYEVLADRGYYPIGCSVDSVTGNLAVTNCCADVGYYGNIAIYARAKGNAKYYTDESIRQYGFCSYDGHGNLFFDGISQGSYTSKVAEMPKGGHQFTPITLDQSLGGNNISGLFWDGEYLAMRHSSRSPSR